MFRPATGGTAAPAFPHSSSAQNRSRFVILAVLLVIVVLVVSIRLFFVDDHLLGGKKSSRPSTLIRSAASQDESSQEEQENDYPIVPQPPGADDTSPIKEPACAAENKIRVFDVVSFFNEADIYEIRVGELFDAVDVFITVEANTTFQGHPKPVLFQKLRKQFPASFSSKLRNYFCGPLIGVTNWDRERHHRRCMQDAVAYFGAKRHDLVIFGDADEIPDAGDITVMRNFVDAARCRPHRNHIPTQLFRRMFPLAFRMTIFFYNFRWISRPLKWTTDLHMYDGNPRHLQRGAVLGRSSVSGESRDQLFFGKGWHCSWCFDRLSKFRNKFDSYSHSEFKSAKGYETEHLLSVVCHGQEIFKHAGKFAAGNTHNVSKLTAKAALENAPRYLRENLAKFPYLLPMDDPPCKVIED